MYLQVYVSIYVYLRLHVALLSQQLVVLDEVGVQRAGPAALRFVYEPRALDSGTAAERHLTSDCAKNMYNLELKHNKNIF